MVFNTSLLLHPVQQDVIEIKIPNRALLEPLSPALLQRPVHQERHPLLRLAPVGPQARNLLEIVVRRRPPEHCVPAADHHQVADSVGRELVLS